MKFLALIYFVLSLFGCDIGGSSYVTRTTVDGTDTLYSQATTQAGVARFECLRSASGSCHYSVYAHGCAPTSGPDQTPSGSCESDPIERFTVARGDSRQIAGLTGFDLCVSAEDAGMGNPCRVAGQL